MSPLLKKNCPSAGQYAVCKTTGRKMLHNVATRSGQGGGGGTMFVLVKNCQVPGLKGGKISQTFQYIDAKFDSFV
jgi:hypothetical protein